MGQDQGLYQRRGRLILHGGVPYRDAWDPKPPGVFYIHAALLALRHRSLAALPARRAPSAARCGTLLFGVTDFVYSLGLGALSFSLARRLRLRPSRPLLAFGLTPIFSNLALLDPEAARPKRRPRARRSASSWPGWTRCARGGGAGSSWPAPGRLAALLKPPD